MEPSRAPYSEGARDGLAGVVVRCLAGEAFKDADQQCALRLGVELQVEIEITFQNKCITI